MSTSTTNNQQSTSTTSTPNANQSFKSSKDWNNQEVVAWLDKMENLYHIPREDTEPFRSRTGPYLNLLKRESFMAESKSGTALFDSFQSLIKPNESKDTVMGEQRVSPKKGLSHIPAGVGLKYEGINLNNKDYIKREAKLSTLITHLDQDRIVFIHSPPFTGKTSLCQLLELRLKTEKPDAYTRRLSWIWSEDDEYEALWKKYTEHTFNEWIDISQNDHVYLILDECQAIYSPNSVHFKFWSRLKSVVSPNIHILVVSAYGQVLSSEGRAPISLIESARAKLDYSFMFFDEQEYRQLVNLFCQTSINLSNDVEHLIWLYSGGHIGLIVKTLTKMQEKFTPSGGNSTVPKDTQIMEYLYSSEYSVDIVETRSTPLKYNLDEKKLRIMDSIAHSELYHSSKITVDEDVDWLIRRGYLVRDHRHPDYLRFSSPLYNRYWTLQRLANNQQLLGYLPQPQ